jgi:hypothetical protein
MVISETKRGLLWSQILCINFKWFAEKEIVSKDLWECPVKDETADKGNNKITELAIALFNTNDLWECLVKDEIAELLLYSL